MAIIFNKVTKEWNSTDDTEGLSSDWIIDPTYDDFSRCQLLGPKYWVFTSNVIGTYTDEEINSNSTFTSEAKVKKLNELEETFNSKMYSEIEYSSHSFSVSEKIRNDIHTLSGYADKALSGGLEWPTNFEWLDVNLVAVPMTALQMVELSTTIFSFSTKCFQNYWVHKININNLTTVNDVNDYNVSTDWPTVNDYSTPTVGVKYLNSKASNSFSINFASDVSPYIKKNTTSYNIVSRFIYAGESNLGVASSIKVVGEVIGSGQASIKLTNITTGDIICEKTNIIQSGIQIIDLGSISNLPNQSAVFELSTKTTVKNTSINISGIHIFF